MDRIIVRKGALSDINTIIEFQRLMALETENVVLDINLVGKGIQAMFDDPSKGTYYVATLNDKVVGCHSITYEWSDWRNAMVWWIQSVYVVEKHRKNGVLKAMLDNVKKLVAADQKLAGIRLYVDKTNLKAQRAYEALGMNGDHYSVFELMK